MKRLVIPFLFLYCLFQVIRLKILLWLKPEQPLIAILLLLACVSASKAQSASCANGDQLVVNTSTKTYQCITPGAQPAGTGTTMLVANETITGTTVNRLAKLTGAPSKAIVTATTDTENAIGIVTAGAGTTGNATIAIIGQASCQFDGATTAGDYFTISATTAGMCHDAGSSFPTSGATYGRVLSTNGASGTFVVELMTPDIAFQNAGNGKSKPGGNANELQFNSSSQFAGTGGTTWSSTNSNLTMNQPSISANAPQLDLATTWNNTGVTFEGIRLNAIDTNSAAASALMNLKRSNASVFSVGKNGAISIPVSGSTITIAQNGQFIWQGGGANLTAGPSSSSSQATVLFSSTWASTIRNFTAASGSTNDPDFGANAYLYRITPNAAGSTLTGGRDIAQTTEMHEIANVGSAALILSNNSSSSSAGRRWLTASNLNLQLAPNQKALYLYDGTTNNLRIGKLESSETVNVTAQFDKTNATLADVTGLTQNVSASRTYNFTATLYYDANVTGGAQFAIAGTATATAIIYQINTVCNASNLNVITSRQTALAGSAGQAGCTAGYTEINGTITVNAAGTLTVQFAQNTASGTSSVLVGSTFYINNIN